MAMLEDFNVSQRLPGFSFRKIISQQSWDNVVSFLRDDVSKHGGSASETVERWDELWEITVSQVPWGTIVIEKPITVGEYLIAFINAK